MPSLIFKINFSFVCSTAREAVKGVHYCPLLHESTTKVLGMPSLEMKNEFTLCFQIINSLESVGMEGTRGYG